MKLLKTVKKILALSTGAVMVGATVMGASAANLNEYPSPWVKDGSFNGIIVVGDGEGTSPADVLGAIDIGISLQYATRVMKTYQSSGGGTTSQVSVVGGDSWMAEDFEVSERGTTGEAEPLHEITSEIGEDELEIVLADGTLESSDNDYDYDQTLAFDSVAASSNGLVSRSVVFAKSKNEDNDDMIDLFFYVKRDDQIANYVLDFESSVKSDLTDSDGDVGDGDILYDLEGQTITLLGKEWDIIEAEASKSGDPAVYSGVALTLMGGASYASLSSDEPTGNYEIAGMNYAVTLDLITEDRARFIVNGNLTKRMRIGDTHKLRDGAIIGVKDVVLQEFDGGTRSAEFYIGTNKLELEDDNITDELYGSRLVVGNDRLDAADVKITGGFPSDSRIEIDTIEINIKADDNVFLPAGSLLSEQLVEPEVLLGAWDIRYEGLETVRTEPISLVDSGDDQYILEFVDGSENTVEVPLFHSPEANKIRFGSDAERLVLHERQEINADDYFVVSNSEEDDESQRKTYVVQYEGAIRGEMDFKVLKGETITKTYKQDTTLSTDDTITTLELGKGKYKVYPADATDTSDESDFAIKVDLDGDGTLNKTSSADPITITTHAGAKITIAGSAVNRADVYGTLGEDDELTGGTLSAESSPSLSVTIDAGVGYDYDTDPSAVALEIFAELEVLDSKISSDSEDLFIAYERDEDVAYTSLGARVLYDTSDSVPTLTMQFPVEQAFAQLFVVSPEVQITTVEGGVETSETGAGTYWETNEISVGTAMLASEVRDIRAQNAIVIGGPCANTAAAILMDSPEPCGKDFTVNTALIRLFEHPNGNVAMLVAGYDAIDTRRAARVVAEYEKWQGTNQFSGMDLTITGTSFTNIQVAATN